jgi:hypothetical protein
MEKPTEELTPEEIKELEESRAVSDTQAVRDGAKIKPDNKLEFTEEQIEEARERMEKALSSDPYQIIPLLVLQLREIDRIVELARKENDEIERHIVANYSDRVEEFKKDPWTYTTSGRDYVKNQRLLVDKEKEREKTLDFKRSLEARPEFDPARLPEKLESLITEEESLMEEKLDVEKRHHDLLHGPIPEFINYYTFRDMADRNVPILWKRLGEIEHRLGEIEKQKEGLGLMLG